MNAVTQLEAGREALDLNDADMTDPETVLDGTGGDDDGVSRETSGEAKNEPKLTREEIMKNEGMTELQKECATAMREIKTGETKRSEINNQIQAVRERMEAKGISKKALAMAIQVSKMNEDDLDGFDTAYLILRKAIELPVQSDMFNFKS